MRMTSVESDPVARRADGGQVEPSSLQGLDSNPLFRAAFEHAPFGMAIVDQDQGVLTVVNKALCDMLGYDRAELQGKHFTDFTHPDDLERSARQLREVERARGSHAVQIEKRYLRKDGQPVWARVSISSITGPSGDFLQHVIHVDDITARKQAEAAAAASQERFRLAFESAASGMALVSPEDGRFLKVNAAGCRMLGYTHDELRELTIQDVTSPEDREESFARFRRVISGEDSFSQAKLHYLRADGSTAYAIISTALVRDGSGEPLHLVANVVDITEQVRAQDQLKEMVASKDQLIASVSHELRTPLTAIFGFAEMLRGESDALEPDERVELVQSIADQTSDLTNIVEDLLVAARADNDTLTVVHVPVDLRAQAAQVVETIGHDYTSLSVELIGETTRGIGDPARVRQILRNLVSNAYRYGGSKIEIRCHNHGDTAHLEVVDDGPGVPPEDRDRIFRPYHRSPNREGLTASIGLGLTVSRKLARLMEGDLTYRTEDGESIFELTLPSGPAGS